MTSVDNIHAFVEKTKADFDSRLKWANEGNERYHELCQNIIDYKSLANTELTLQVSQFATIIKEL